jgi:hypothetical protein
VPVAAVLPVRVEVAVRCIAPTHVLDENCEPALDGFPRQRVFAVALLVVGRTNEDDGSALVRVGLIQVGAKADAIAHSGGKVF